MPVTKGNPITQADMDALADLANLKVTPIGSAFEFPYMDETIPATTEVRGTSAAGAGYQTIRVWAYKIVAGRKHYSPFFQGGFYRFDGPTVDWEWDAVPGADGYIVAPQNGFRYPRAEYLYAEDVSTNSITVSASPTWGSIRNPCANDIWASELSRIKLCARAESPEVFTPISGPWVVSVGNVLRGAEDWFDDIQCWFAAASGADVELQTIVEMGTDLLPKNIFSGSGGPTSTSAWNITYTLTTGGTFTGRIVWKQSGSGAGWTHAASVFSGAATIDSETWTEIDDQTLQLDFTATMPSGACVLRFEITTAAGNLLHNHSLGTTPRFAIAWDDTVFPDLAGPSLLHSGTLVLDSETKTPSAANAIHPTLPGWKFSTADIDFSIGPASCSGLGGDGICSFRVIGGQDHVWVAKTIPPVGVNTFVDMSLPNYWNASTPPLDFNAFFGTQLRTRIAKYDPSIGYLPDFGEISTAFGNLPAFYPTIRDTATIPTLFISNDYVDTGGDEFPSRFVEATSVMLGVDGADGGVVTAPTGGFCIYEVTIQRAATLQSNGKYAVPDEGAELEIKIGTVHDVTDDDPGTFVEFQTVILPENEKSINVEVFWPVLKSIDYADTPSPFSFVSWQCDEWVTVLSRVNFQPCLISRFNGGNSGQGTGTFGLYHYGDFSGRPFYYEAVGYGLDLNFWRGALIFNNDTNFNGQSGTENTVVTLPPPANVYNEIEEMLNAIP